MRSRGLLAGSAGLAILGVGVLAPLAPDLGWPWPAGAAVDASGSDDVRSDDGGEWSGDGAQSSRATSEATVLAESTPATATAPPPDASPAPPLTTRVGASTRTGGEAPLTTAPAEATRWSDAAPWRGTAEDFGRDFGTAGPDWTERVARWTSPHLAEQLSISDPLRRPTGTLMSVEPQIDGESTVWVVAGYAGDSGDGFRVIIRLDLAADGWLVTDVAPAGPGDSTS